MVGLNIKFIVGVRVGPVFEGFYMFCTFHIQWARKVLTGLYMLITFFLFKVQPPNFFS
jgi:hypothetical protein